MLRNSTWGARIIRELIHPPSERRLSPELCDLEHFPPKVGVETIVEGVGVAGEYLVVGQRELHPAHDNIQSLGLGASVLLVHQIGVVDYLGDLVKHRIVQLVLFKERLEGAVLAVVGEPGPYNIEELRPRSRYLPRDSRAL